MIITIVSPDKLTQSMFIDFYSKTYLKSQIISFSDTSVLYDVEIQTNQFKKYKESKSSTNWMVKYQIKKNTPTDSLPDIVFEVSDYVIKFDIYSTYLEVIKSSDSEHMDDVSAQWEQYLKNMEKY